MFGVEARQAKRRAALRQSIEGGISLVEGDGVFRVIQNRQEIPKTPDTTPIDPGSGGSTFFPQPAKSIGIRLPVRH